ncbi:hypothetical protein GCM10023081_17200 [Arthrobacter ginkgonis]|uniref:Uncharacterized protein n=1 Tax=Arthrobacter ginkgonis TaxID=1630594 RepID=A0ABP7C725_9MICC
MTPPLQATPAPLIRRRIVQRIALTAGALIGALAVLAALGYLALMALFAHLGWSMEQEAVRAEAIGAQGARIAETLQGVVAATSSEARSGDLATGESVFIHVDIGTWNADTALTVAREIGTWRSENEDDHLELRAAVIAQNAYMAISSQPEENGFRVDVIDQMLAREGIAGVTLVPLPYEGSEIDSGGMSNASLTMKLHPAAGVDEHKVEAVWESDPPTIRVPDHSRVNEDTGYPRLELYRDSPIPTQIVPPIDLAPGERYDEAGTSLPREPYLDPDGILGNPFSS